MSQPEKTFRIGFCSASVFLNESQDNRTFRAVSLQRRYKDGGEWKSSTSFNLSDLPAAIKVMEMALDYVASREAESSA